MMIVKLHVVQKHTSFVSSPLSASSQRTPTTIHLGPGISAVSLLSAYV